MYMYNDIDINIVEDGGTKLVSPSAIKQHKGICKKQMLSGMFPYKPSILGTPIFRKPPCI